MRCCCLRILVFVVSVVSAHNAVAQTDEALRESLVARIQMLESLVVFAETTEDYGPKRSVTESGDVDGRERSTVYGRFTTSIELWKKGDLVRYGSGLTEDTLQRIRDGEASLINESETTVIGNDSSAFLSKQMHRTKHVGRITNREVIPELGIYEGIGLAIIRRPGTDFSDVLNLAQISETKEGVIEVHAEVQGAFFTWQFDPGMGLAMTRCQVRMSPDGPVRVEVAGADFQLVDGVMLPMNIAIRDIDLDGRSSERLIEVQKYDLDHPDNTSEKYEMVWPEGAWVKDARTGATYFGGPNGELIANIREDRVIDKFDDSTESKNLVSTNSRSAISNKDDSSNNSENEISDGEVSKGDEKNSKMWIYAILVSLLLAIAAGIAYRRSRAKTA